MNRAALLICGLLFVAVSDARAQSSSMFRRAAERERRIAEQAKGQNQSATVAGSSVDRARPLNAELERVSLFAVRTKRPVEFKVHDLITVIVREQKSYQSEVLLRNKREFAIETKLAEFFRTLNGHLAAASFTDGKPNIDFALETEMKGRGNTERDDKLTFRMTTEIIDIKPNGLLVLSGKQKITVDEEIQDMRFTGTCRSREVTADNTILSTQVFDQVIYIQHKGAMRAAGKRGWLVQLFDWLTPI